MKRKNPAAVALGRRGGKVASEAQKRAARENGKRGGRPKGIMATRFDNRWKAILGMSSDHAGINRELRRLQSDMYRTLAAVEDPRRVRDYLNILRAASLQWLTYEREYCSRK